jgi:hypothetical protein
LGVIDGNWYEIIILLGRITNVAVPMIKAIVFMFVVAAVTMMPHLAVVAVAVVAVAVVAVAVAVVAVAVAVVAVVAVVAAIAAIAVIAVIAAIAIAMIIRNIILRSRICVVIPRPVLLRRFVGETVFA